jgi:hypothetical protein
MKTFARIIIGSVATCVALVLAMALCLYGAAWQHRGRAERMLATARTFQPGVTTEEQFHKAMSPWASYQSFGIESTSKATSRVEVYGIANYPDWLPKYSERCPYFLLRLLGTATLPGTVFGLSPRFSNGKLVLLHVSESQAGVDGIHPFYVDVSIYARSAEANDPRIEDANFSGYRVIPYIQSFDERPEKSWVIREYVDLDDRATGQQKKQALDFKLECFTDIHGCRDANKILQPAR